MTEGHGYEPDYWLDTSDSVTEIAKWMNSPSDYRFAFDVDAWRDAIDCEQWLNGIPEGLHREVCVNEDFQPFSQIVRDTTVVSQGKASCLLSGDAQTRNWAYLIRNVPLRGKRIVAKFAVKGDGITPGSESYCYNDCHVGFSTINKAGKKSFFIKSFSGTFDWETDSVSVDLGPDIVECDFHCMLSMPGKLWVDDIRFDSDSAAPQPK